jgi:MiaB-like tRNA modifying enzyme
MRVHVETYGCTYNLGDSRRIEAILKYGGCQVSSSTNPWSKFIPEENFVIVNTCIVTSRTERDMLKRISFLRSRGKDVVVAGCLPAVEKMGEPFLTPQNIEKICDIFKIPRPEQSIPVSDIRGILQISSGCISRCTYCITKNARGNLKSYPIDHLKKIAEEYVRRGAKEIQLTSQDTSAYGIDIGCDLPSLINEIASLHGDFMLRVGMMNPATALPILDGLLDAYENPKVFKFLHLPVQSGSDRILRKMGRRYTRDEFLFIVKKFRSRFQELTISTDFIVGFPSEKEEEFEQSLELLKEIKSTKVNIKRFSARKGTPAWRMEDMLERTKKERSRKMSELSRKISLDILSGMEGKSLPGIVLEEGKGNSFIARDNSYKPILTKQRVVLGKRYIFHINDATPWYLISDYVKPE